MSDDALDQDDPEARLAALSQAKSAAIDRCHYRTANRLAAEIKRTARAERKLEPYIWALHTLMNHAPSLLEPEAGQEAAIELIAVLESEERARAIQPDIDAGALEWLVSRVSSCAYDGLGRSTALARGYNSDGLHETVAEGIQVCRRTGKLECITCFRRYASDIVRAADDLDMALHHARHVVSTGKVNDQFDNRFAGASEEAALLLITGRLDEASAAIERSCSFIAGYHNPVSARLKINQTRDTLRLLTGAETTDLAAPDPSQLLDGDIPPVDEAPAYHLYQDLNTALNATLRNDHAAAIQLLTNWDRRLTERHCLDYWFEVRLHLIAAYRLAGTPDRAAGLARQLEAKARDARDWLTLRRLALLLDPEFPDLPTAPIGPYTRLGSTATPSAPSLEPDPATLPVAEGDADPTAADVPTPLGAALDELTTRLMATDQDDDEVRRSSLATLLGLGPDQATDPSDVARLLHLARSLAEDPALGLAVWDWAEAIAAPFPSDAVVLSTLGALGDILRATEEPAVLDRIDPERVEHLFRHSLDLDSNNPGNFGRAAVHHASMGRMNEAERCLARFVRLDRTNVRATLWLSEIYNQSERASEALAIIDMALRAGSESPELAWQAVVLAHGMGQNEALLTYLDHYEAILPEQPWANYYRASGLLRLDRAEEALVALEAEARINPANLLHVLILRACAAAALGRVDDLRANLGAVLAIPLVSVNYLTRTGLINLFERLGLAVEALPADDPALGALIDRMVVAGLAPDSVFRPIRLRQPKVEGLSYYVCTVTQPLGPTWSESPGCLAGEEGWTGYRIGWGVLASDEATATQLVLDWQQGNPQAATVEDVTLQGEGYTDHPGVVWQGGRAVIE